MVAVDLQVLYGLLVDVSRRPRPQLYYAELSAEYERLTGEYFEPHGSWHEPLGEINRRVYSSGLPALSAVVVLRDTDEPGHGFWGSAPQVPAFRADPVERIATYAEILRAVQKADWPANLPG